MALKIQWSRKADQSFDEIINYLKNEWGENTARKFVKQTFQFLSILSEFPKIGPLQVNKKDIRGFTLNKRVLVFYTIKKETIVLLDFFQTAQNPPNTEQPSDFERYSSKLTDPTLQQSEKQNDPRMLGAGSEKRAVRSRPVGTRRFRLFLCRG